MKILITDGNCRSSLAVTRALGEKGISVVVCEEFSDNLSAASKYCFKSYTYPSPYTDPRAFLNSVKQIIAGESIDIILPMTDVTMEIILSASGELPQNLLSALPSYSSYTLLTDKINMLKTASQLGLHVPESIVIKNRKELLATGKKINFPVIVKPMRSKLFYDGRFISTSVLFAESQESLLSLYEQNEYLKKPFMIQKVIQGYGAGIFALFNHGEPVVFFCHKRLRESPPSGGVSALSESIPLDHALKEAADKLLKAADWHGVAMVEFKVDGKTGIPYLMEVNGRFWGSLQLAIDSGVDFPYLLCHPNSKYNQITGYRIGKKSRWLLGDLDHLYFRLFKTTGNEGLPNGTMAKIRAIYEFIKYNGGDCNFDVISLKDIKPFIVELKHYCTGNHQ